MDSRIKRELISTGVSSVVMPLVRAGADHYFTMQQMDKEGEMAAEVAERKQQSIEAMRRASGGARAGGGVAPVGAGAPADPASPGEVYDELQTIKGETDCSFCHQVADKLMEAPPEEARAGYQELRSYVREAERIENRDISQTEAEQIVTDLVDQWETVPKYMAQMA